MAEDNPFTSSQVAAEWIESVENEHGKTRDRELYPRLASWAGSFSKGTIVEVGSGQGICSLQIPPGLNYLGIEPSVFLVARAKEIYHQPYRQFLVGDAYKLPVDSQIAEGIFIINVLFHLRDLNMAFREAARVLKPSGRFFIVTSNPSAEYLWRSWYYDCVEDNEKIVGKVKVPVRDMSLNTFYKHSLNDIEIAAQGAGLKIEKVEEFGLPTDQEPPPIFIEITGHKQL